jgi:hypothetical protein
MGEPEIKSKNSYGGTAQFSSWTVLGPIFIQLSCALKRVTLTLMKTVVPITAHHPLFGGRALLPAVRKPAWQLSRHRPAIYWIAALICLAAIHVGSFGRLTMRPVFGDDSSIYIASADSLAHGGGYRLPYYLDAPPAQVFPIGYPLLLALIFKIVALGPTSIFIARLLNVACILIWAETGRRLLTRVLNPAMAACAALAIALNPLTIRMCDQVKSDLIFAALLMSAIMVALGQSDEETRKSLHFRGIAIGVIAACAMIVRTIGFTLVAGLAIEMLVNRRWAKLAGFFASVAFMLGPWILWSFVHNGGTFHSYAAENVITWRTPFYNFRVLLAQMAPYTLFAPLEMPAWHAFSSKFHLAWITTLIGFALAVVVIAGWANLFVRRHLISIVLACYMSIVFFWWFDPSRFVIPILPLIIYCSAIGARRMLSRVKFPRRQYAFAALGICVLGAVMVDGVKVARAWQYGDPEGAGAAREWSQLQQGLEWIHENTADNSLVFSTYPAGVYLFTDRHTLDLNNASHIGSVWTPSYSADLGARLQKVDSDDPVYVYATADRDQNVLHYISAHPEGFALKWKSETDPMFVYEVNRAMRGGVGSPRP